MPWDRPDRLEILRTVETFLDETIKPRIDGADGYHLRIAINLLRVLQRELSSGETLERAEREGYEALLPDASQLEDPHAELCKRIRSGQIRHDDPALLKHLRRTVLEKIAIDQPKYASYLDVKAHGWRDERS